MSATREGEPEVPDNERLHSTHEALDALEYAIAVEVAQRYSAEEIRACSRANLERWKRNGVWGPAYEEWQAIIDGGDDEALYMATLSQSDDANRLRQSMPFVGMLPPEVLEPLREAASGVRASA